MKTAAILPYGGDSHPAGQQCGPETKVRLEKVIDLVLAFRDTYFTIFLSAGLDPDQPSFPTLRLKMRSYLRTRFISEEAAAERKGENFLMPEIVVIGEYAWGTIQETIVVAEELRSRNIKHCYVVSSWYHLVRILCIWKRLSGFRISPVPAWAYRFSTLVMELPKLLVTMVCMKKLVPRLPRPIEPKLSSV